MQKKKKKIAHDLLPLTDTVTELSTILSQLLLMIKPHAKFDSPQASNYFDEFSEALNGLTLSIGLMKKYVSDVNIEADNNGIAKD